MSVSKYLTLSLLGLVLLPLTVQAQSSDVAPSGTPANGEVATAPATSEVQAPTAPVSLPAPVTTQVQPAAEAAPARAVRPATVIAKRRVFIVTPPLPAACGASWRRGGPVLSHFAEAPLLAVSRDLRAQAWSTGAESPAKVRHFSEGVIGPFRLSGAESRVVSSSYP